jgi:hypothetical protein
MNSVFDNNEEKLTCPYCGRDEDECEKNTESEMNPITHWIGWGVSCDDCYYENNPVVEEEEEEEEEEEFECDNCGKSMGTDCGSCSDCLINGFKYGVKVGDDDEDSDDEDDEDSDDEDSDDEDSDDEDSDNEIHYHCRDDNCDNGLSNGDGLRFCYSCLRKRLEDTTASDDLKKKYQVEMKRINPDSITLYRITNPIEYALLVATGAL